MLRLPRFRYIEARTAQEASALLAESQAPAMFVAGGTDLFPKMKRRQFTPSLLVGISALPDARGIAGDPGGGFDIGAAVTLNEAASHVGLGAALAGYADAARSVSSPPLRNAGTVGGNLCVDTRCNYYDQTYEWRRAAGFCLKRDGDICLVAPGSHRCWAVSSTDTAPMAIALGATVVLAGPDSERELPVSALYNDDGIDYLAKQPHEVVTRLRIPAPPNVRTAYVKLRRRGSIDFPIGGAAVALQLEDEIVQGCRIVLSGSGSHPIEAGEAEEFLVGNRLDADSIRHAGELAAKPAKPLDNADLSHFWRKRMMRVIVEQALQKAAAQGQPKLTSGD